MNNLEYRLTCLTSQITKDVVNALQMRIDSLEKELSELKMDKGDGEFSVDCCSSANNDTVPL